MQKDLKFCSSSTKKLLVKSNFLSSKSLRNSFAIARSSVCSALLSPSFNLIPLSQYFSYIIIKFSTALVAFWIAFSESESIKGNNVSANLAMFH